tara:strand:- start:43772 stop:44149 length:378 start_codon:yes stop_codon:yes gene_type:complete
MNDLITPEELRRERDYERLRTRNPICLTCGYDKHPAALELSHLVPHRFHDEGGPQCRNCHREFSDAEKDYPYAPQSINPQMETIGRYLLALAEWFKRIADTIAAFGAWLLQQAEHVRPYEPEAVA